MAVEHSKKPHSILSFLWETIQIAWKRSREKYGLVIDLFFFAAAVLLVVFVWYSKNHTTFNADKENGIMSYWLAIIPAGLWILWFLYHLVKAPYEIYKEQFESHQSELKEIESFHQKMIDKASESLAERGRKIDELEKNLARGSVGDRLVLNKIKSKELLGFYLADLRFRINTVKQINEFNYGGDIQEKVEEESKRVLLRGSQLLYQNLTSSEAEFFNEAKAQPLPEPNQWSPQIHQANNLKRHINMLQSKYNELKRIIDKI